MKLKKLMEDAIAKNIDELDFFIDALDKGFTLKDFEEIGHYNYAKEFMEEHGLM